MIQTATVEKLAVLKIEDIELECDPVIPLLINPKGLKTRSQKDTCTPMFTGVHNSQKVETT
jgi:hypothetical protein